MTYDENDDYNGPDSTRRGPFLFMAALVGVILVAGFGAAVSDAHAEGSDSVTPYTVTAEGVSLPDGVTFPDSGHVNIRSTGGDRSIHFEAKCVTRTDAECADLHETAQYIGASFIPWTVFGLTDGDCITWTQLSMFNEHYGEAGQPPICIGGTPSNPAQTPAPSATETPTPTTTTPATPEPSPSPSPSVTPSPTSASPTPSTTTPSSTPAPSLSPSTSPISASTDSLALTFSGQPDNSRLATPASARLADTGTTDKLGFTLLMGLMTLLGVGVLLISRRVS